MSIKKNLLIFLFIIAVFTSVVFFYNNNQIKEIGGTPFFNMDGWESVFAGTCSSGSHNMTGWAYSNVIGAISLNCGNCNGTNCTQGYDYGVNIDSNRNLSGYAWSPSIGPISFNASEICANENCTGAFPTGGAVTSNHTAKVVYVSNGLAKITGWARALSACDFNGTTCTKNGAGDNAGGWDGWIKFDGSTGSTFVDGGLPYNTIIRTVGSEHQVQGNVWGGVLDTNTPPSAVLGEIRFLSSAKTTYNPNNACPVATPVGGFKFSCLNGPITSGPCYYKRGTSVGLTNESTDADNTSCNLTKTNIKQSTWNSTTHSSVLNNVVVLRNENPGSLTMAQQIALQSTSFTPLPAWDLQDISFSASLVVKDDENKQNSPLTRTVILRRSIVADYSCCIKNINGGEDCLENSHFKSCNDSSFAGLTVTEGTVLYLRDNTSLTTAHSVPAYSNTITNRSWEYTGGAITGSGENFNVPIVKDAKITLSATDTSLLTDKEEKLLSDGAGGMFSKIVPNPDFTEIPFD